MGTINFETSRDPVALFSLARTGKWSDNWSVFFKETRNNFHLFISFLFFCSLFFYFRPVLSLKLTTKRKNSLQDRKISRRDIYRGNDIFFFKRNRRKNISMQPVNVELKSNHVNVLII